MGYKPLKVKTYILHLQILRSFICLAAILDCEFRAALEFPTFPVTLLTWRRVFVGFSAEKSERLKFCLQITMEKISSFYWYANSFNAHVNTNLNARNGDYSFYIVIEHFACLKSWNLDVGMTEMTFFQLQVGKTKKLAKYNCVKSF